MTQPVQEPTADRAMGGAYWATSQLARRPPPPVAATANTYNWARTRAWNVADQSVASGSETNVYFNEYWDDGAAKMQAYNLGGGVGSQHGIHTLVDGLYSITCRLMWHTYQGAFMIRLSGIDIDAWETWGNSSAAMTGSNSFSTTLTVIARMHNGKDIIPTVYQNSGSSQNLLGVGGCFLEMIYMGSVGMGKQAGGYPSTG